MANHMNKNPKTGKKKGTKAAIAASFAALLLCGATLVGTTFAWFTDTATTGTNVIQAGELGIDLKVYDSSSNADDEGYTSVRGHDLESGVKIFDNTNATTANANNSSTLWEPGKVQIAYFKIENTKSLALKYRAVLNVENPAGGKNLYEVMEYVNVPNVKGSEALQNRTDVDFSKAQSVKVGDQLVKNVENDGHLLPGQSHYFAVAIRMQEGADNAYQNGQVKFTLRVEATQDTVESDSFDEQYDRNANYLGLNTETKQYSESDLIKGLNTNTIDSTGFPTSTTSEKTFLARNKYTLSNDLNPNNWIRIYEKPEGVILNGTEWWSYGIDNIQYSEREKYLEYVEERKEEISKQRYANYNVDIAISFNQDVSDNLLTLFATAESTLQNGTDSLPFLENCTTANLEKIVAQQEYRVYQNHWDNWWKNIKQEAGIEYEIGGVNYGVDNYKYNESPTMSYQDVAARTLLDGFEFGIIQQENATLPTDLEMTAELRLYETNDGEETGSYVVLATDTYKLG